ncbi:MAG: hypothetical protein M3Y08_12305 [Fibrobacterota bacterium]|nr:hypothetical protein [Fibrobacterota bacterium]
MKMKLTVSAKFFLCVTLTTLLGFIDFISGWELGFFVFYFVPIFLITWGIGKKAGTFVAIYAALTWFAADALLEKHYSSWFFLFWNTAIRLVADLLMVYLVSKIKDLYEIQEKTLSELVEANRKVKVLSGVLPICASCKNIRNDKGYWEQMEVYISKFSHAEFSHGICGECIAKLYPEYRVKLSENEELGDST